MIISFTIGATIGLLHLPTVWHLIGVARAYSIHGIYVSSTNLLGIITSLVSGIAKPIGYESWALIGIPIVYIFIRSFICDIKQSVFFQAHTFTPQKIALLISLIVLVLFATGKIYQGHHIFDTFRVPVRAIAFVAVVISLFVFISYGLVNPTSTNPSQLSIVNWFLMASVIQIGIITFSDLRPHGALNSPYDPEAQILVEFLQDDKAKSVWFSSTDFSDMYIPVALSDHGIALPNVYYGDMGQEIPVQGSYCGYSFDHLVSLFSGRDIALFSSMKDEVLGIIPMHNLQPIGQFTLDTKIYYVFRVVCDQ